MLRNVHEDDLPILFEHQRDPEASRMAAFPSRDWHAFMHHWRTKVLADPNNLAKAIVVAEQVVGNIGSWNDSRGRFVGYWIDRAHWGRGIASAALTEFLRQEPVRPLWASVAAQNPASIRVLEKCGFRRVGGSEVGADGVEEWLFQRVS